MEEEKWLLCPNWNRETKFPAKRMEALVYSLCPKRELLIPRNRKENNLLAGQISNEAKRKLFQEKHVKN